MKQRGFKQGIYETSANRKEVVGTRREDALGKKWMYAMNGATEIAAGVFAVGEAMSANHYNEAILAAVAVGAQSLNLTITAGIVADENEFKGGEFLINDATGEGHTYRITSSTAVTVSGTTINLSLERPIQVALDTTTEFTLVRPVGYGAVIAPSGTLTLPIIGVTPLVVPISHYFWAQRAGICSVLNCSTTMVTGQNVQQSAAVDGAMTVGTNSDVIPTLGKCIYAPAAGEYAAVDLNLD